MLATDPIATRIVAFVTEIGIPVVATALDDDTPLPAMSVRRGTLLVDWARLTEPGDLLHEAGHIAVTDPAVRGTLDAIASDPGEEIAAICWSYAAARAIGLDPSVVFHQAGYRGDGAWLAETFAGGTYIGLPLLAWYGITTTEGYPTMTRWLR